LKTIPNTPRRLPEKWEAAQFLLASTGAYFSNKSKHISCKYDDSRNDAMKSAVTQIRGKLGNGKVE